jgi:hypothetical protein
MGSLLDERLAEIDERLRSLQSGLEPVDDAPADTGPPEPPRTPLHPVPPPTPLYASASAEAAGSDRQQPAGSERIISQLRELGDAHERLLDLHRDLLSQYAELLAQRAAATASMSVTAGPFADGDAVRAFERGLRGLPGVSATTTREYLAGDRVAFDVRIDAR